MSVRLKRLQNDYEKLLTELTGNRHIKIEKVIGKPPEHYFLVYFLKGLKLDNDCPVETERHEVEIYLPQTYPREKPQCLIHTPIFHPNFSANRSPNTICVGDYWAASSSLMDIIIKIGEMIQYRDYNVKSPLDAVAARWALDNEQVFPIGNVDLYQPEFEIEFVNSKAKEVENSLHDDFEIKLY